MASVTPLSEDEVTQLLSDHPSWELAREGKAADSHDHHPEWFNVYAKVEITLTTHDADGLSIRDAKMARAIDAIAG